MKALLMAAACAAVLTLAPTAAVKAQAATADVEEIVVTGSRIASQDYDADENTPPPYVQITRRADNLIVTVRVTCDTRDDAQRLNELRQTLASMGRAAAQSPQIELGVGDSIISRFDETGLDALIRTDPARVQVSYADFIVKTAIQPTDTFDGASGRIKAFVKAIHGVGRTEALIVGDFELTIKAPERYRPDVLAAISADARTTAAAFGPEYAVHVDGMDHRLTWLKSGPLDLSLFIPYRLAVTPK